MLRPGYGAAGPERVAGEEEAVLVPQQRGLTPSVARRKDYAEARRNVALARYLVDRHRR